MGLGIERRRIDCNGERDGTGIAVDASSAKGFTSWNGETGVTVGVQKQLVTTRVGESCWTVGAERVVSGEQ